MSISQPQDSKNPYEWTDNQLEYSILVVAKVGCALIASIGFASLGMHLGWWTATLNLAHTHAVTMLAVGGACFAIFLGIFTIFLKKKANYLPPSLYLQTIFAEISTKFGSLGIKRYPKLDQNQINTLETWLEKVLKHAKGMPATVASHFVRRIKDYIEFAADNSEFCDYFIEIIGNATASCGDSSILTTLFIDLKYQGFKIGLNNTAKLANFLKNQVWALEILQDYAGEHVKKVTCDHISAFLGLPYALRGNLGLNVGMNKMFHYGLAHYTQADLDMAEESVRRAWKDESLFLEFLTKNDLWIKALKFNYPKDFEGFFAKKNEAEEDQEIADLENQYTQMLMKLTIASVQKTDFWLRLQ